MVLQLPVNGRRQSVVVTAGKQMIFDIVEAETGKYLSSIDLGLQNLVTSIDPKTGAKITDPNLLPGDGKTKMICPHVSGGRGWMPTSYDAGDQDPVRADRGGVHGSRAGRGRRARQPVDRCPLDGPAAAGERRQVRPSAGAQSRDEEDGCGSTVSARRSRPAPWSRPAAWSLSARSTGCFSRTTPPPARSSGRRV